MENHWTGRKHSLESRKKMSISASERKRKPCSEETKKKISESNKGKVHSIEWRQNQSKAKKGKPQTWLIGNTFGKASKGHRGLRGSEHPNWIKDRSKLAKRQERNDSAYKEWRINVYKRDNFKCRICNKDCSGKIESHHIFSWIKFPLLRYQINNGVTLCQAHHPKCRAEEKRLIPSFRELVSVSNSKYFGKFIN